MHQNSAPTLINPVQQLQPTVLTQFEVLCENRKF